MDSIKITCHYADTQYEVDFPRNMIKYSTFLNDACSIADVDKIECPIPMQEECWGNIKKFLQLRIDNPEHADEMDRKAVDLEHQDELSDIDKEVIFNLDVMQTIRMADASDKLGIRPLTVLASKRLAREIRETDLDKIESMFKPMPVDGKPLWHILP